MSKEIVNKEVVFVGEGERRKRGRKKKDQVVKFEVNREQSKFFVDLSGDKENLNLIFEYLEKANNKSYGREILFKDLAIYSIPKMTDKDIEKIQESCLSEMEKVQRALEEHNKKMGLNLTMGEFLIKKLGIN